MLEVFDRSGRVVPVFIDKHLADNWADAKWIYDEAQAPEVPMMAGSSLPVLWRYPPADVRRGARLDQIVVVSYRTLDAYGFHAMEVDRNAWPSAEPAARRVSARCSASRARPSGGPAPRASTTEPCWTRRSRRLKERPLPAGKRIEELVPEPVLFVVDYSDGLRGCVFTLNGAVASGLPRGGTRGIGRSSSTLFWTQEARPFAHFNLLLMGIERMMQTGRPTWPVERTLLTSGILDAALRSQPRRRPTPRDALARRLLHQRLELDRAAPTAARAGALRSAAGTAWDSESAPVGAGCAGDPTALAGAVEWCDPIALAGADRRHSRLLQKSGSADGVASDRRNHTGSGSEAGPGRPSGLLQRGIGANPRYSLSPCQNTLAAATQPISRTNLPQPGR